MSEPILLVSEEQNYLSITLNRPEQRNALSGELIAALTEAFQSVADRPNCRAVLLQGSGSSFCAGADLNWMKQTAAYSKEENLAEAKKLAKLLNLIFNCAVPVVAYAHGHAYGGAIGILAACDTVIASEETKFCLSEVRLGLIPATIYPYLLYKMGANWVTHLSLTASPFPASEAQQYGLVHTLGEQDKLDDVMKQLKHNSPAACRAAKKLIRNLNPIPEQHQALTSQALADIRESAEAQEGLQAFFEKRKPHWVTDHD